MDKVCRVFKHVIKITRLAFLESGCLNILIENLTSAFNCYQHPSFFYLLFKYNALFRNGLTKPNRYNFDERSMVKESYHPALQYLLY